MANTREYLFFSDVTMANPNGDMINDNRPRLDERTGYLEMSDVRIKRYIRDEWVNQGEKVFVRPVKKGDDSYMNCKEVAQKVLKDDNVSKANLEQHLKDTYKDVKLFGAVITDPKFNITGPLQIMWSKSVNQAEIVFAQGTSAFSSKSEAKQGTIWSKYFTPYALFKTYMVYNDMTAKRQNIDVTEADLEDFRDAMISGIKNYRSTSKNQMPRLLVEVIYKGNYIDGELDYINIEKKLPDLELRSIEDMVFDLSPLASYYSSKKDRIEKINIYKHEKLRLADMPGEFSYYSL